MIDLTGRTFGKLTVIRREGTRKRRQGTQPTWLCNCECGKTAVVGGVELRHGLTKSCGCLQRPHGMFGTPEYKAWTSMKGRCENPRARQYKNYGARGISVAERWRVSFATFLADMGRRPTSKHSIDRINNDGNYEPGNCRWATKTQQARNTRVSRVLSAGGTSATIPEWAERTGIGASAIRERLRRGWSPERAVGISVS